MSETSAEIAIPELDDLRIRLDQMTERITGRFKDRSRFPFNAPIYVADALPIEGRQGISLLEFAIEGLESYHASLGRFDRADQFAVLGRNLPKTNVLGDLPSTENMSKPDFGSSDGLISFYISLVKKYCEPGEDAEHYRETAYIDADLIQIMHERINIGRLVAAVKALQDPTIFDCVDDEQIEAKLRDKARERNLLDKVRRIASRYELNPQFATDAFKWIVERTLQVEVKYLQAKSDNNTKEDSSIKLDQGRLSKVMDTENGQVLPDAPEHIWGIAPRSSLWKPRDNRPRFTGWSG